MNDVEFISAFINEVGRNRETAKALKTGGIFPSGNIRKLARIGLDLHSFVIAVRKRREV